MPDIDLTGQVAVVTGGGRGIGRGIALTLASAGAAVAIAGRTPETLESTLETIQEAGGRAAAVEVDVTDRASVDHMLQSVETQLGSVDLLVNNAGILGSLGPLWKADPDDWWQVMNVNLRGPFLCMRAVLPGMVQRQRGRIVNVASVAAVAPAAIYSSHYAASKAALVRLTDVVSREVAGYGIAVFAINPGLVHTDMLTHIVESEEGQRWRPDVGEWFKAGHAIPPDTSGRMVAFLASGQADALSGRFLDVADDLVELVNHAGDISRDDRYRLRWHR